MKFLVVILLIVLIALILFAVMDISRRLYKPKITTRAEIVAQDRRRMLTKMYADSYNDFTPEGESLRAAIEEELGPVAITKLREELNK